MTKDTDAEIVLNAVPVQVWTLHTPDTYGIVNKAHAQFLGLKKTEIENKKISAFLPKSKIKDILKYNKEAFKKKKPMVFEGWLSFGKKEAFLRINWQPKIDKNGKVNSVVCSAEDLTEIKKREEEAEFLSFHDQLTGLYNRRFLEEEIKRLDTKRQLPISLIVADINNLKVVNDTYGHKFGDELLKCAADIIDKACRKEDIIARWGGDEFVILLSKTDEKSAKTVAHRIGNYCEKHNKICNSKLKFPVSIAVGTATKTNMKQSIKNMLKTADKNMYSDKLSIKSREGQ